MNQSHFVDVHGYRYAGTLSVRAWLLKGDKPYYRHFGRFYLVLALEKNMADANAYMAANPGTGLLTELDTGDCVIVSLADKGIETLPTKPGPVVAAPSGRILTARFACNDLDAIEHAIQLYASSLGTDVTDVNARVQVCEDCIMVVGRAQAVMSIIGGVADQGHDGLVSVS